MIEAGFWFLLGFLFASWLAYRAQKRTQAKVLQSFQAAKTEIIRLIDEARELTEIRITIIDRNGELELETEEDPPAATSSRPPKSFH